MLEFDVLCDKHSENLHPGAPTVIDFAVTDVWALSPGQKLYVRLYKHLSCAKCATVLP